MFGRNKPKERRVVIDYDWIQFNSRGHRYQAWTVLKNGKDIIRTRNSIKQMHDYYIRMNELETKTENVKVS